ncbi:MAG: NlpC/P60 family protein [Fimbriimonadales bacterium]
MSARLGAICALLIFATPCLPAGDQARTRVLAGSLAPTEAVASTGPANPFGSGSQAGRKIGDLAQARDTFQIYAQPSTKSEVRWTGKTFDYLVSVPFNATWTKILLNNGEYGYVLNPKIDVFPYQVIAHDAGHPWSTLSLGGSAQAASRLVGTPATKKLKGGGFVSRVFSESGVHLATSLKKQSETGRPVARLEDLEPGDRLYFWDEDSGRLGFSGIYLGKGYFVGPLPDKHEIATDYLGKKKWLNILLCARR